MNDPYVVLGLPSDADEATIRRRYLELVRESPPDRDPERFAVIRAAYEQARDPARRLTALILEPTDSDSLDALAADIRARLVKARPSLEALLSLADSQ